MKLRVIGVFCDLDGVSFALFHGEQRQNESGVAVRWRHAGDLPAAYRAWQEVEVRDRFTIVQAHLALSRLEVEWRDPDGFWRQAALLVLVPGSARFRVAAKVDLALPEGFTAVAPAGVRGVASYRFGPLSLPAGASVEVDAVTEGLAIANLLLEPGEFAPVDPAVTISNLTATSGGHAPSPLGVPLLQRNPGLPQNYFARMPAQSPPP